MRLHSPTLASPSQCVTPRGSPHVLVPRTALVVRSVTPRLARLSNPSLPMLSRITLLVALLPQSQAVSVRALHAARLLDVEAGRILDNATVLVEGERIRAVNPKEIPAGAEVIELGDRTLLPGLIDCHTHLRATSRASGCGARCSRPWARPRCAARRTRARRCSPASRRCATSARAASRTSP